MRCCWKDRASSNPSVLIRYFDKLRARLDLVCRNSARRLRGEPYLTIVLA